METLTPEQRAELATLLDVQSQLVWLLYNGTPEAVEHIIKEKGADVNYIPSNGMPPLYKAVVDNIPNPSAMIDILVKYGANINWENSKDKKSSPLYNAASKNYIKCVEALLKHKPDLDYKFNGKYTSLWKASCEGYADVVELLCIAAANKEIGGENVEDTPLFAATERGKSKAVEVLLKYGANYEATVNGHTISYRAADFGQPEVLEVLFKHGISPDQHTPKTSSPLYVASQKGRTKVVEVLLKYKANVNYKFNVYYTPLWKAAFEGHADIVKMLIDAGSSVNVRPPTGTPLYLAAQNGHTKVVEVLLKANADIEIEVKGTRALEEAAKNNHKQCVQLLLQAGARYESPDNQNPKDFDISALKQSNVSFRSKPFSHILVHHNTIYLAYQGDSTITAWNLQGQIVHSLKGHNDDITAMFIHDNYLYTGSADKRLIIWDKETGERIQTLTGHYGAITSILFHCYTRRDKATGDIPKKILYTGSADTTIKGWDPESGYTLQIKYSGHKGPVTCLLARNSMIYSMSYDVLYTASADGTIRAIDMETSQCLFSLPAHGGPINSLVEFNDILFTSSSDKMLRAFNRLSTRCLNSLSDYGVPNCMIVYGGLAFAGFSDNNSLTTWEIKTSQINCLKGFSAAIKCIYQVGNLLYIGSDDGAIKVFSYEEDLITTTTSTSISDTKDRDPKEIILKAPVQKTETEDERQAKLTREIFNKIEAMEDQMMVMSKNIQDLYLILKRVEGNIEKPKLGTK